MRLAVLFILAALASLAAQTIAMRFAPAMLVPDLVLILAVDLGLRHPGVAAALLAFAMGYAIDSFSNSQIGLNAFMLTLIFMLAYGLSLQVLVSSPILEAFLVLLAAIIQSLGVLILSAGLDTILDADPSLFGRIMVQALSTAIVTPLILRALVACKRLLGLPLQPAARE